MSTTPCIRCGKIRIVKRTWTEKVGGSAVEYTMTVCPDPECQKAVEEQLQKKQDKLASIQEESKRRKAKIRNRKSIRI
jgi:hypothetical protein